VLDRRRGPANESARSVIAEATASAQGPGGIGVAPYRRRKRGAEVRMSTDNPEDRRSMSPLANLSVTVHRVMDGEKTTVFAYVGDVDATRIAVVLDHVERLCAAGSGEWHVEVESTQPGPLLFRALTRRFLDGRQARGRESFVVSTAPPARRPAVPSSAVAQWFPPFPQAPW